MDDGLLKRVAKAICKSKTCEGAACCQWPGNGGRPRRLPHCNAERGAYDDAARSAIEAMREPTEAMVEAGELARVENTAVYFDGSEVASSNVVPLAYSAMIDAALAHPGG